MSEEEDLVDNVESRGPAVRACWISNKGISSRRFCYDPGEETCRLTKRVSMSRFHGFLKEFREASENQNAFLLNDFNKVHEK